VSGKIPIFSCPQCNAAVEGKADYIARGLKCPECGIGFSPILVKYRGRERSEEMSEADSDNTLLLVIAFFLPIIGIIVGAIRLSDLKTRQSGHRLILVSLFSFILCVIAILLVAVLLR
jgi:DNA-directed RNA polymerase subunit RPC12/RpoP